MPAEDDPAEPRPPASRWLLRASLGMLVVAGLGVAGTWVALRSSLAREALAGDPPALSSPRDHRYPGSFPKQGPNECGAYSLAYGLTGLGSEADGPALVERVSHRLGWSSALSGTLPWKISAELESRGFQGQQYSASWAEPSDRLRLLAARLASPAPVMVLIESERDAQHYVLLLRCVALEEPDDWEFDFYDPNHDEDPARPGHTVDANGSDRPGNRTYSGRELLTRWAGGGGGGLYRWWYLPLTRR